MIPTYILSPEAAKAPHVLLRLDHDVEFTVFGEDGRDSTFKALAGDYLVFVESGERWVPVGSVTDDVAVEDYRVS